MLISGFEARKYEFKAFKMVFFRLIYLFYIIYLGLTPQSRGHNQADPTIKDTGGWGIAALTFGIDRIWTSYKPEFYWVMVILGLTEGTILAAFCLINVFFLEISLLQAMLPLSVGGVYGILYFVALRKLLRFGRTN